MHDISKIFNRFKYDIKKIIQYGFKKKENTFYLDKTSQNNAFIFHIEINNNKVLSQVLDKSTNEEYMPFYIESINGEYVGSIRDEFNMLIKDILSTCYEKDYNNQTLQKVIEYVNKTYNIKPEYLWEDTPNTFVFKHPESKWFGIVMDIPYKKVGINSDEIVYVMNVKEPSEKIESLTSENGIVPAYHMNKKYWISILLDGSVNINKIKKLIDTSYDLTK
jgi:predicted DNA-binding protein (MmcQ/YjbR family)